MTEQGLTRRDALRTLAAGGAATAFVGEAGARGQPPARIVGTASRDAEREARRRADSVKRVLDFGDIGKAVAGRFSDRAARELRKRDDVRYVEEDGTMHAISIDSDDGEVPWGVDRVDAEKVHDAGETGGDNTDGEGGADIAIIDTGIDDDHPDLQANVGKGKAYVKCRGPNCNYAWSDDNDHGTHCAGIADAVDNGEGVVGVSTAATLHAVKVLDKNGSGSFSDIASGIKYVADQGWDVGSMSLGASSGSQTVKDACNHAYNNGVLLVAAAGNDGPCTGCVSFPANYDEVIAVSATTRDDSLANFSSTGNSVELAAPGQNIYSTVIGGYDTFSGTSMACPHVAGAGGQLMDNGYPNAEDTSDDTQNPGGARGQLRDTAEDIDLASNEQGYGLLDVEAALGGSTDAAPSVSWVNPSGGETVSGTVTVQIDASDSEDSDDTLDVTYTVDGGSSRSASYNSTSGSYEDSWDTTGVSDGDHTLEANATDSAGNTSSSSITVTTDNTESAPTVDSLSATEVETSDGDAEFDVSWGVSDADGDLSSVDLTLTQDSDGSTEDTANVSVSGDTASGTTRLVAAGDDGSGNSYTVDATVTDSSGNTGSGSTSVSETEDTDSAPTIDSFSVSTRTTGPWFRAESNWSVSDADGDLESVTTELLDSSGKPLDSASSSVSGSSASGTHETRTRSNDADSVRLTVTDAAGNSTLDSKSL